jgi:insulin receptor
LDQLLFFSVANHRLLFFRDALIVRDNQNLQELWDWSSKPKGLKIKQGKLFFHFNPKLCIYKIKKLQENSGLPNYTDSEVARDSNGDKVACKY